MTSTEQSATGHSLAIDGEWRLMLDPHDQGERDRWFADIAYGDARPESAPIQLPGSLQEQGYGDSIAIDTPWTGQLEDRSYYTDDRYARYREPGRISVPFWLQPAVYYQGVAWYQREVHVPTDWADQSVVMSLERVHWESAVWVDDVRIGSERSLSAPHEYRLGRLSPGRHRLTIRVDNRMIVDVGPNAHSVSDHTQGNWNGVIGAMTLRTVPNVSIRRVATFPDVARRSVRVAVDLTGGTRGLGVGKVTVTARLLAAPGGTSQVAEAALEDHRQDLFESGVTESAGHVDIDLALGDQAKLWDEFHPHLYELITVVETSVDGERSSDSRTTTFGLREVGVSGTHIAVNGRPTFIRGTLECCVFPLTGYPPTDMEPWRKIIDVCRAHGLNLLRFHSWCPPEAAFAAADELGFYFQVEGPIWANLGSSIGEGRSVDGFLIEECRRIVDVYGNHPSFLMMAHGNEPAGRDEEFLAAWVSLMRRLDPRRLYTAGSAWPVLTENDFDIISEPRIQHWGEGLGSRINSQPPETITDYREWVEGRPRPVIGHEIGQWCAYPDLAEIERYTGLMSARNFSIFQDFLVDAGLDDRAEEFLNASGRLQKLCYKEDIESALRTAGFGGFHLLGLSDFPGQGTAPVGVLNAFWEEKGYCTADEFARFCGPTVPLVRLPKRTFDTAEQLTAEVQVAHFGSDSEHMTISWSLSDESGHVWHSGNIGTVFVEVGNKDIHGVLSVSLSDIAEASKLSLLVEAESASGQRYENDWDIWVYPEPERLPARPGVSFSLDIEDSIRRAEAGERVVLFPNLGSPHTDVAFGFSTIFWNTSCTKNQPPHTLGITHDTHHPLFSAFPSAGHTDWQWWEPLEGAQAMILDELPQIEPIVRPIDTWFTARRLGLLWEAQIGSGGVLVCSMRLDGDQRQSQPAARQMLAALSRYVCSEEFAPQVTITGDQLRNCLGTDTGRR